MTKTKASVYFLVSLLTQSIAVIDWTCKELNIPPICTCEDGPGHHETTARCSSNLTHILDINSDFINNTNHLYIFGETSLFTFNQRNCVINCAYSNLKTLDVEGHNRDIEIRDSHMSSLTHLETLRLHHCNIIKISNGAFDSLHVLKVFEVSGNGFLTFESIDAGLEGLNAPGLEIFNVSGNQNEESVPFATISKSFFSKLSHTSLKVLDLSWTKVLSLQTTFLRLPHLEELIFSGTPILGERSCLLSILALENLTTLVWNTWPYLPGGYESIKRLPKPPYRYKKGIDSDCDDADYFSNNGCLIGQQNLKTVQIRNLLADVVFLGGLQTGFCLESNNVVNWLMPGGKISQPYGLMLGLHQVRVFDVGFPLSSSDEESFQPYNAFYDLPSVEVLLVGGNRLNKISSDLLSAMFSKNKLLKFLDISKNDFKMLPRAIFECNSFLGYINISFNMLETISLNFTQNNNLKTIDLRNNNLKTIDAYTIKGLNSQTHVIQIFLTNNKFECECGLFDLVSASYINTSFYCSSNGKDVLIASNLTLFDDSIFICDVELSDHATKTSTPLVIGLTAAGIILVLVCVISVILYSRHKKVNKNANSGKNTSNSTMLNDITLITLPSVSERGGNSIRKFVAFLAYSYTDTNFVFKKIYPRLCEQLAARLPDRDPNSLILVHDKHFLPGSDIDEIIESAIVDSYVTIAIISDSFLNSHWCHFEVKMSQISNVPIIPLYLNECDPKKFRGELKLMYHTKVRLLWPLESSHDTNDLLKEENKIVDTVCVSVLTYMNRCFEQQDEIQIKKS